MKKILVAVALMALPTVASAQDINAFPGWYITGGGGLGWGLSNPQNGVYSGMAWDAGGGVGYDFVGPRVDMTVSYGQTPVNVSIPGTAINGKVGQLNTMLNLYYDFMPNSVWTPFIGAGAGVAFIDSNTALGSTQFAYQGTIGASYHIDNQWSLSLAGVFAGTTSPCITVNGVSSCSQNNGLGVAAGIRYKFGAPAMAVAAPAPAAPQAPSFMVFFDWDRSNLSAQALNTIKQAAGAYKTKGSARVTATGHTDKSGPDSYNMALSLRRANTVKDALVREGVPATAISVIGKGETQPLVQTADGVREPQNRRVEIVIQ